MSKMCSFDQIFKHQINIVQRLVKTFLRKLLCLKKIVVNKAFANRNAKRLVSTMEHSLFVLSLFDFLLRLALS